MPEPRPLHRYCPACRKPIRPGEQTRTVMGPRGDTIVVHARCLGGDGPRPTPPEPGRRTVLAA